MGAATTLILTLAWVALFVTVQAAALRLAPELAGSLWGQLTLCSLYAVGLLQGVLWLGRREAHLAASALPQPAAPAPPAPSPEAERRAVWLSLGGGALGSMLWIFPLCWMAGDAATALATLAVGGAIVGLGLRAALREPARYDAVAARVFAGLGAWSLVAVNLRWAAWMEAFRDSPFAQGSVELPLWAMNLLLAATIAHVLAALRRQARRRRAPA
jgi:hypothetical protein